MAFELLAVGDIHLGRTPQGLPAGFEPERFSPRAAWQAAVEEALRRKVDAVALLGDVVDHDRNFLEAYSPLRQGVEKLLAAGIQVVAIVGNHDVEVLPRLAREISGLRLLGAGGAWEALELRGRAGGTLRLVGWSFPRPRVTEDPVASLPAALRGRANLPTLGLVHGELDASASYHAPLRRTLLAACGFDGWLLGHVHQPTLDSSKDSIGYLGSLVGLDAGEQGRRGPWSVRVEANGAIRFEHLPLARIRWEALELALDADSAPEQVESQLVRLFEAAAKAPARQWGDAELVAVRLAVRGRSSRRREIVQRLRELEQGTPVSTGSLTFFLEKLEDRTQPELELESLAKQHHAAGGVARRLLALQDPASPERSALLRKARQREETLRSNPSFVLPEFQPCDDETLVRELTEQGFQLLERLVQGEGSDA
ncbi:MAG: DNA repair exonuclease [Planctomycetota bacterium]|nr:DNA repair exonuclease [Planctomycetota bacterium]